MKQNSKHIKTIGIDCATNHKLIGLAMGYFSGNKAKIKKVTVGGNENSVIEVIAGWITEKQPTLLGLDAPLGWPANLSKSLLNHQAGEPIYADPNEIFRRLTDRIVKQQIGKQPLDGGADRIARTAHSAVNLIHELRNKTRQSIPLLWTPVFEAGINAIEVYPAATLKAHKMKSEGYKGEKGKTNRIAILDKLKNHIELPDDDMDLMTNNDNALDAVVCVLATVDFLKQDVIKPEESQIKLARKEGWIWVKNLSHIT